MGFIYSAFFYLVVGVVLGVLFTFIPELRKLSAVHGHANLIGFISFMVFGIAYHILPRFRGRPLYSETLGWVQLWMANIGLAGFLIFLVLEKYMEIPPFLPGLFASLLGLSILLFVYNIGRTLLEPYKEE